MSQANPFHRGMIRTAAVALLVLLASCAADRTRFDLTDFERFTFERLFGLVSGPIQAATIRRADDAWHVQLTVWHPFDESDPDCAWWTGVAEDCPSLTMLSERPLTATEITRLTEVFSNVAVERHADDETCPLWDPAFIDRFAWDQLLLTTNLCEAPYLAHAQAKQILAVLEGLR